MPLPKSIEKTAEDYWALPEDARAELIDGELWALASPSRKHQEVLGELFHFAKLHIAAHGGSCKVYQAPFAVNLFGDNSTFVEPDFSIVCDRSKLSDRGCEGAPDFIVEIVSPSNPGMDYVTKLNLYQEAGVREYWICDPQRERTMVYHLEADATPSIYPFATPVASSVLPGFEVDFASIVARM